MNVKELLKLFSDFYKDFDINKAKEMIKNLNLEENEKIKLFEVKYLITSIH